MTRPPPFPIASTASHLSEQTPDVASGAHGSRCATGCASVVRRCCRPGFLSVNLAFRWGRRHSESDGCPFISGNAIIEYKRRAARINRTAAHGRFHRTTFTRSADQADLSRRSIWAGRHDHRNIRRVLDRDLPRNDAGHASVDRDRYLFRHRHGNLARGRFGHHPACRHGNSLHSLLGNVLASGHRDRFGA